MKKIYCVLTSLMFLGMTMNASDSCLIACYSFSGNADNDLGTGFNGVVVGASLTADRFGTPNSAYLFDGLGNHIVLGMLNAMNNTDEFTYSFWCSAKFVGTTNIPIRTQPDDGTDRMAFSVNYVGGSPTRLFFDCGNIFGTGRLGSGSQPYDNLWHHYVFTRSTIHNFRKVYLDGVLFISGTAGDVLDDKNRELWIGGGIHETGSNEYHNGKIDDIKIYNCALSATDVSDLYSQTIACSGASSILQTNNNSIAIYPNPSSERLHFSNIEGYTDLHIEIYSATGSLIETYNKLDEANSIHIGNIAKGAYIISVKSKELSFSQKLIIE